MPQVAHFDRVDYRTYLVNGHNEPQAVMIETRGLTRAFGAVRAVDGLDMSVRRGEIFGLVGPDGAGKTTALRLLAAIMDPTAGWARVAGFDTRRQAEAVKHHIGYMSQQFSLYGDLSARQNAASTIRRRWRRKQRWRRRRPTWPWRRPASPCSTRNWHATR